MTKNNDELILELTKEIEKREAEIQDKQHFKPITNCSISLLSNTFNFHVMHVIDLFVLKSLLGNFPESVRKTQKMGMFTIEEYIQDIQGFIDKKETTQLAQELKSKKNRLEELLSADAKKQVELDEIKKSLGL